MKTVTSVYSFLCLELAALTATAFLAVFPVTACADHEDAQVAAHKPGNLILSLPSQWQPAESSATMGMRRTSQPNGDVNRADAAQSSKQEEIRVGCNLGTYDASVTTASFANRMEGNCKLNVPY